MQISIIGLPRSGKTTIFNVVTRGKAEVAAYQDPEGKPNVGVAKVLDQRLHRLEVVYRPKRVVPAEITYVDIPAAPDGLGKTRGLAGKHLNHLQGADALLVVARAFDDPSVSHVDDTVDPFRDVETALLELAFADLETDDESAKSLLETESQ